MKKCSICKGLKANHCFNKKKSSKDGLQTKCRDCSKTMSKNYYSANLSRLRGLNKKNAAKYISRNREFVYQFLLKNPCIDCGESNPVKLDFDHLKNKKMEISKMIVRPVSIKTLEDEIDKCEIRCSNCHRVKTAKDHSWWTHTRYLMEKDKDEEK